MTECWGSDLSTIEKYDHVNTHSINGENMYEIGEWDYIETITAGMW